MSRAREHLRSNIVGYVALFFVFAGAAYALPGKNTVDSGDIRNGQVKTGDIRNSHVRSADLRNEGVVGRDIATGAVGTSEIGDSAISGADVGPDTLTGTDILESSLEGVNAATLAGREVCEINTRLTVSDSSNTSLTTPGCTVGPLQIILECADSPADVVTADINLVTSVNDTSVAATGTPGEIDAGGTRTLLDGGDGSEDDVPNISSPATFSAWVLGGPHLTGHTVLRANSLANDTGTCDFAVFATG